jgi:hypothetical protein
MIENAYEPVAAMKGYRYKHGDRPLDGYTVQRAAGRGGFGEVYYAISDSGREVALKVVQAYEQVELRGTGHCINLKSPHLVSIFDVRQADDGQPIIIMEFVAGPSLRELLDESPSGLGTQKAAFFLREIGKGLTYLHDCGIVHRDLKPANIFYENGYVKIGDYGLSKAIGTSHRGGQTLTVGTVHYMAPEVGGGCYDRSVDIYALGVLLYEMLTGQPPFYGASTAEVLMKHLGTIADVTGIPEPFATVIRKALAKEPSQRYDTVQQMVEAVYGADHIRQSVSVFSPDSLTLVAGHVAGRAGIRPQGFGHAGRPFSSRALDPDAQGIAYDAAPGWADRMGMRLSRIAQRLSRIGGGIAALVGARGRPNAAALSRIADPMPTQQRVLLAFLVVAAMGLATSVFSEQREIGGSIFFVILWIIGAALGIRWATSSLLSSMQGESRFLQKATVGGVACIAGLVASFPSTIFFSHSQARFLPPTLAAICAGLLLLDWRYRTQPGRRERVSFGDLINCGILGVVVSLIFQPDPAVVIATLCGVSMTIQILTPWVPGLAAARFQDEHFPARDRPARPAVPLPQAAFDFPGIISSGRLGLEAPRELKRELGTAAWPQLFRAIGGAGLFAVGTLAAVILMLTRRRRGGHAMARAVVAIAMLLATPFLLAGSHVTWGPGPMWNTPDWTNVIDEVLGRINTSNAIRAGATFVAALLLLLWPTSPRTRKLLSDQTATAA